eukprot:COSAG02_NODE_1396_length_12898_cov_23.802953_2_plen_76_part_00
MITGCHKAFLMRILVRIRTILNPADFRPTRPVSGEIADSSSPGTLEHVAYLVGHLAADRIPECSEFMKFLVRIQY